jgi:hypothetical protein
LAYLINTTRHNCAPTNSRINAWQKHYWFLLSPATLRGYFILTSIAMKKQIRPCTGSTALKAVVVKDCWRIDKIILLIYPRYFMSITGMHQDTFS